MLFVWQGTEKLPKGGDYRQMLWRKYAEAGRSWHYSIFFLSTYNFHPPQCLLLSKDTGDLHGPWTICTAGEGNTKGPEELAELHPIGRGSIPEGLEKMFLRPYRWSYPLQCVDNNIEEWLEVFVGNALLLINQKLPGYNWVSIEIR